jgi:hypothetical protein
MSEAARLRAELKKKRQAVSNKINRIQKTTGAKVSGSEFDPRRKSGVENTYNVRQLRTHIAQLNEFMQRGNQFVAGSRGAPIPRTLFATYKRLEGYYEQARVQHDKSVSDVVTPSGLTVAQNKAMVPQSSGSSVYGPYREFDREPSDIKNAGALKTLIADMRKRSKANYLDRKISEGRENIEKVLTILGDQENLERIDKMSDYQFDIFWFGNPGVVESIFMHYGIEKQRAAGTRKEQWQDKVVESAANELGPVLDDIAANVPRDRPGKR